jgi:hypothetical protein
MTTLERYRQALRAIAGARSPRANRARTMNRWRVAGTRKTYTLLAWMRETARKALETTSTLLAPAGRIRGRKCWLVARLARPVRVDLANALRDLRVRSPIGRWANGAGNAIPPALGAELPRLLTARGAKPWTQCGGSCRASPNRAFERGTTIVNPLIWKQASLPLALRPAFVAGLMIAPSSREEPLWLRHCTADPMDGMVDWFEHALWRSSSSQRAGLFWAPPLALQRSTRPKLLQARR